MQCYRKNLMKVRRKEPAVPGRKLCRFHINTKPERPRISTVAERDTSEPNNGLCAFERGPTGRMRAYR